METEDIIEEQKKDLQTKLDAAQKNVKVLEIKARSYQDQGKSALCGSDCLIAGSDCQPM